MRFSLLQGGLHVIAGVSLLQLCEAGNVKRGRDIFLADLKRHKFEPYRGYIAEHPNDEEEVEGIDLHQQRYPWEGSDMDYLYNESSFAQLLSMELTLEIDGAIFHVPNANTSSNVDSQL
ncbi:hypothetical protein DY000_02055510 [Brassica cretica]|uniref:Uncharacterized protein n=1 Tax=Brassica cretica TaxID=69181 RepID=A0ABQ7A5U1_BRACR|nr:hypothetical protein DY000_02055510 [Brassica cretica]